MKNKFIILDKVVGVILESKNELVIRKELESRMEDYLLNNKECYYKVVETKEYKMFIIKCLGGK